MKYLLPIFLLFTSCATVVRPTGGDKDTKPPQVLRTLPHSYASNYKGNEVQFTFDEYIEIKELNGILISPPQKNKPKITVVNKSVRVLFNEPLTNNTTYTIELINAINDLNEKNVLPHASLTFTTGASLDTGKICGFVHDNMTGKQQNSFTVALFHDDIHNYPDSLIFPLYTTKTKENGSFQLSGLPENTAFSIFTFNDINNNLIIDLGEEMGFSENPVLVGDSITLKSVLYQIDRQVTFSTPIVLDNRTFLIPLKKKDHQQVEIVSTQKSYDKTQTLYTYFRHNDTLVVVDFIKKPSDSLVTYYLSPPDTITVKYVSENPTNRLWLALNNNYAPGKSITFNTLQPLRNINISKVVIRDKDNLRVNGYSIKNDLFSLDLLFEAKEKAQYSVIFPDSAILYMDGSYSTADTFQLSIQEKNKFGELTIQINNANRRKYRLQLLTEFNQKPIVEQETDSDNLPFSFIPAGEYYIRLEQLEQNKRGDLIIPFKQSPSYVYIHDTKVKVRGGWLISDFILHNRDE